MIITGFNTICNLRQRQQEFNWISNILIRLIYWVQSYDYQKYPFYRLKAFPTFFGQLWSPKTKTPIYHGPQFTAGFCLPPKPAVNQGFTVYRKIKDETKMVPCPFNKTIWVSWKIERKWKGHIIQVHDCRYPLQLVVYCNCSHSLQLQQFLATAAIQRKSSNSPQLRLFNAKWREVSRIWKLRGHLFRSGHLII